MINQLKFSGKANFVRMLKDRLGIKKKAPLLADRKRYATTDRLIRPQPYIRGQKLCRCCFDSGLYNFNYWLEGSELIWFCSSECFDYYTSEIRF